MHRQCVTSDLITRRSSHDSRPSALCDNYRPTETDCRTLRGRPDGGWDELWLAASCHLPLQHGVWPTNEHDARNRCRWSRFSVAIRDARRRPLHGDERVAWGYRTNLEMWRSGHQLQEAVVGSIGKVVRIKLGRPTPFHWTPFPSKPNKPRLKTCRQNAVHWPVFYSMEFGPWSNREPFHTAVCISYYTNYTMFF